MKQNEIQTPRAGGNGTGRAGETSRSGLPDRAHDASERLRETAIDKAGQARDRVREGFGEGRQQVVNRIRGVGSALRSTSNSLRSSDDVVARYMETASRRIESAADYVSTAEVADLVREAERFARRQPAIFFGGAFLLGLAVGRFVKSSRSESSESELDITRSRFGATPRRGYGYERPYGAPIQPKPTAPIGGSQSARPSGTSGVYTGGTSGSSTYGGTSGSTRPPSSPPPASTGSPYTGSGASNAGSTYSGAQTPYSPAQTPGATSQYGSTSSASQGGAIRPLSTPPPKTTTSIGSTGATPSPADSPRTGGTGTPEKS